MIRNNVEPIYPVCVQPAFIIGTNNKDKTYNFAPASWVSGTEKEEGKYMLVISMTGTSRTKENMMRDGRLSVNLVSRDMLTLMDYLGSKHGEDGPKDDIYYGVGRGKNIDVPTLDASPWVYECEVDKTVNNGVSTTFFCDIRNIQKDINLGGEDQFDVDLTVLDPVIYSGRYHSLGEMLGEVGDFLPDADIIRDAKKEKQNHEEEAQVIAELQRKREIMYILYVWGIIILLSGMALAESTMIPTILGVVMLVVAWVYSFISGANECPYCGTRFEKSGHGTFCKSCGKRLEL